MGILTEVISKFDLPAGHTEIIPYGNGHINDTYLVTVEGTEVRYILQRINDYVFPRPDEVMENILHVTQYLQEAIRKEGGDPLRETMTVIPCRDGKVYTRDEDGKYWRVFICVPDSVSPDLPDSPEMLEECGRVFGFFARRLSDYPAATLYESIHDFHNTPMRLTQLEEAVTRNAAGRLGEVQAELDFARSRESATHILLDAHARGEIPLRVTHNDTKVNNVLLDARTGRAMCVVDLDTVMPGFAAYDFGDAVRVGASAAAEDERDLSRVGLVMDKYKAFSRGFLTAMQGMMTETEIRLLPEGARLMTLENGLRFLADHLNGDVYFKVHRPGQNLDRARAQFALVRDIEKRMEEMTEALLRI